MGSNCKNNENYTVNTLILETEVFISVLCWLQIEANSRRATPALEHR